MAERLFVSFDNELYLHLDMALLLGLRIGLDIMDRSMLCHLVDQEWQLRDWRRCFPPLLGIELGDFVRSA